MIAAFYIRVVDKVSEKENPIQFRQLSQAGDVIAIQPKGFAWGKNEISSPDHIIAHLEVESIEKAREDFMTGEQFHAVDNPYPLRRAARIDISKLPSAIIVEKELKNPEAVKAEYDTRIASKKPMVFDETSDSTFKISKADGFDIYDARAVKAMPITDPVKPIK